jgi:DNA-binding transcriptional regulator YiaG
MTYKELREATGQTEAEVAVGCGVTVGTIRNWESGRSIPRGSMECLMTYCLAYQCTPEQMIEANRNARGGIATEVL